MTAAPSRDLYEQTADWSSYATSHLVRVKAADLSLNVDFPSKTLQGSVELDLERVQPDASELVLDTKLLKISSVTASGETLDYKLGDAHEVFGAPLSIQLKPDCNRVRIEYATDPAAVAVQWLEAQQTAGKQHPFLFTQCQAIHARSLIPIQDTPAVKFSYNATITVPPALVALMSAKAVDAAAAPGSFRFEQAVPIPAYLVALVVGDLASKQIGPRSKVWAEPSVVDAAAWEFDETEKFITMAEQYAGPYMWSHYDVLVLPPSFPYGGMENPTLTFVTPTLLAGDRSLADVVAHEIAHSWSGNLVTNRSWEEFWLNEGFTVFLERKIGAAFHGDEMFKFSASIGWTSLTESVEHYKQTAQLQFTALQPRLEGIDPDDAFSSVPYEKGFNFLWYLERVVGDKGKFQQFLAGWFSKHKHGTVTSAMFRSEFDAFFSDCTALTDIDWQAWLKAEGMPPVTPDFSNPMGDAASMLAKRWIEGSIHGCSKADISGWPARQLMFFLDCIAKEVMGLERVKKMDELYDVTSSRNSEIRLRWYTICIRAQHPEIVEHVVGFLKEQGRMKFVRPLYRELFKWSATKDRAVATFLHNRQQYHNIAAKMIEKDLQLDTPVPP